MSLLGCQERLDWEVTAEGLKVRMPARPPCAYAFTLKIEKAA